MMDANELDILHHNVDDPETFQSERTMVDDEFHIQLEDIIKIKLVTPKRIIHNEQEGVFSNMSVKPTKEFALDDGELPCYDELSEWSECPNYFEECMDEDGNLLIEGLAIGSYFSFFTSGIISIVFGLIGFFTTILIGNDHASVLGKVLKYIMIGSQTGLGITIIRFGWLIKQETYKTVLGYKDSQQVLTSEELDKIQGITNTSIIIMILGLFLLVRSPFKFYQLTRLMKELETSISANMV
ncbi:hypothetical protein BC833DRAFT_568898 [Globomyces pollinis-pini]|nr:hypothetical protein BC833DRAFT_568898 [Globomyces pollinis-pini]